MKEKGNNLIEYRWCECFSFNMYDLFLTQGDRIQILEWDIDKLKIWCDKKKVDEKQKMCSMWE